MLDLRSRPFPFRRRRCKNRRARRCLRGDRLHRAANTASCARRSRRCRCSNRRCRRVLHSRARPACRTGDSDIPSSHPRRRRSCPRWGSWRPRSRADRSPRRCWTPPRHRRRHHRKSLRSHRCRRDRCLRLRPSRRRRRLHLRLPRLRPSRFRRLRRANRCRRPPPSCCRLRCRPLHRRRSLPSLRKPLRHRNRAVRDVSYMRRPPPAGPAPQGG